jgi:hypothetical protein
MAAIFITFSCCHRRQLAGHPHAIRHQDLVDLLQFGDKQTIERIVEAHIPAFSGPPLSHARARQRDTP